MSTHFIHKEMRRMKGMKTTITFALTQRENDYKCKYIWQLLIFKSTYFGMEGLQCAPF